MQKVELYENYLLIKYVKFVIFLTSYFLFYLKKII